MAMPIILSSFGFLGWTVAYIIMIKKGFSDRTYAMPLPVLTLNISWEVVQVFYVPFFSKAHYNFFSLIWIALLFIFVLDFILNFQYLKYGIKYDKKHHINYNIYTFLAQYPYLLYFTLLIISLVLNFSFTAELQSYFGFEKTANFSGILINSIDSILFIKMLFDRNNLDGQSIYIALFKMLGTTASVLSLNYFFSSPLLLGGTITVFILDWIYILLIYNKTPASRIFKFSKA